ncbi:MAG: BACON domain-containing protein [Bacteroidetes bacterium]|nr:BACON domain-containing protein [Bacteroidota bacterium]
MNKTVTIVLLVILPILLQAQVKILFNANKAETAGSADWVIDADSHNLGYGTGPAVLGGGTESNAQRYPTPDQSTVTASTGETYWQGAISAWGIDCRKQGYTVETLPYNGSITYGNSSNAQDLSNYKVFIDCEPNIVYTAAEKTAIMQFVQNGGGLFMVSDHNGSDRNSDGWDSPAIWNDLMSNNGIATNPFGITFDLVSISQTTTNIPNLPNDPILHGIMGDVTAAMWSAGTTMTTSTAANSSVLGIIYKTGSSFGSTNVMFAYASYGNGRVAAIGDSSPCDDGTGDSNDVLYNGWTGDANGNHERLIMNATIWLASSSSASTLSVTPSNQAVSPQAGSTSFNVTSNANWSVSSSQSWCTLGSSSGSNNGTITANFTQNTTNASRTANIIVTVTGLTPVTVTVTQAAPTLSVTPSSQSVSVASGTTPFTVTSNSSWTASSNQSWCTVTPSGTGNGTVTATYSLNNTAASRTANITVTVTGLTPVVVTVTQAAPTLSVTPANQNVSVASGSTSFSVTSNTSWSASSSQAWCTVTTSGSGNGTITANLTQNTTSTSRSANVTVTVSGLSPVIVTVTQAAPTLQVTPSNQDVGVAAGSVSYSITSNTSWTISSNQSWCTVTSPGSGNGSFSANYSQNSTGSSRMATITVNSPGLTPVDVTLTQAAPDITISPSNQDVTDAAGTANFSIVSNTDWSASSNQPWCTVVSSGSGDATLTASYAQNTTTNSRICTISILVSGLSPVTATITQAGMALALEPTNFPTDFSAHNIHIQWIDATGIVAPTGYLVRMSSVSYSDIQVPQDGVPVANSFSDKNVASGIQEVWFKNLIPNTTYYFKIFEYIGTGNTINYKTDGVIQQVSASTGPL